MTAACEVRRALRSDADAIARVHVQSWREAYAHLLPAQVLADLDEQERARRWRMLMDDGVAEIWVALDGDTVVGWAAGSAGRDEDAPRPLELDGLYVLASHHGSGAGQALLEASLGRRAAYLWVAADNPRAHAFYRRNGFVPDGATDVKKLAGAPVATVRLIR